MKYKHKFSLRAGEIAHINGVPCVYLGMGNFGTNTYPGKPAAVADTKRNASQQPLNSDQK